MSEGFERVGTLAEIWRFPVKSMRGERLDPANLTLRGIEGDRQYAFVRSADRSRFPWLTAREVSALVLHEARYESGAAPRTAAVAVTDPTGAARGFWDPALCAALADAAGEAVHPMQLNRGTFDSMPVSLITTASLGAIDAAQGRALDRRRFRINLVVESGTSEGDWLGGCLRFGDGPDAPALRLHEPIQRCVMVTIDPDSAARDPTVMRTVAQRFGNEVGVYGTTGTAGPLAAGMPVYLER